MGKGRSYFKNTLLDNIAYIYKTIDTSFNLDIVRGYYSRLIENRRGRETVRKLLKLWSRSPKLNIPVIHKRINSISELLILLYGND